MQFTSKCLALRLSRGWGKVRENEPSAFTKSTFTPNLMWMMRNVNKNPVRRITHLNFLSRGKFELLHEWVSARVEGSTFWRLHGCGSTSLHPTPGNNSKRVQAVRVPLLGLAAVVSVSCLFSLAGREKRRWRWAWKESASCSDKLPGSYSESTSGFLKNKEPGNRNKRHRRGVNRFTHNSSVFHRRFSSLTASLSCSYYQGLWIVPGFYGWPETLGIILACVCTLLRSLRET